MTLGENIKRIRQEKGLTQKQLGNLCNPPMADSAIRRYEADKANPKKETIEKIAVALKVDPFSLYSFDLTAPELNAVFEKTEKRDPEHPLVPEGVDIKFITIREYKDFCAFIGQYDGDDYTKEELEEIKKFAEFLKSNRKAKPGTPPQD